MRLTTGTDGPSGSKKSPFRICSFASAAKGRRP